MVNQELVNYISSNTRRGVPYEDIQAALLARGHSDYDIVQAINYINGVNAPVDNVNANNPMEPSVAYGLRYFIFGFVVVVLLIILALIFIPFAKDSNENIITIEENSLIQGKSFELLRNNLIKFKLGGKIYNSTVKSRGDILIFSGDESFELEQGVSKNLDLDNDGETDYILKHSPVNEGMLFIQSACTESWECTGWGPCVDEEKIRTCSELRGCGTIGDRPALIEDCFESVQVVSQNIPEETVLTNGSLEDDFEVDDVEELYCGANFVYDVDHYCTGDIEIISNSLETVDCCTTEVVDRLVLSYPLRDIWEATISSGACEEGLPDAITECSVYKCLDEETGYYKGVLGFEEYEKAPGTFSDYCSYFEELSRSRELYCEYSTSDRQNIAGYYFRESVATEVVHNSSGTFLDGVPTRNYPEEAINSGVCQFL